MSDFRRYLLSSVLRSPDDGSGAPGGDTGGGTFDVAAAATELSEQRTRPAPVAEVDYRDPASAPKSLTPRKAGEDLSELRRKNGEIEDRPIEELNYPDDPKYETRTARQAAQDLADYRAQLAARLDGESAPVEAAPIAEQPAEHPEPSGQPDPVQEREQPRTAADILGRAAKLIASENPEERAQAPNLITEAAQQVTAEKQELTHRTGQAYTQAVAQLEGVVAAQLLAEWGSVNPAELAQKDPAAFARLQKMAGVYQGLQQQSAAQQRASQELAGQQFQAWAAQQDIAASKSIPESSNPAFQAAATDLLKGYGYTTDELAAGYAGKANFNLRDARVQRILADATKYRQAQTAARNATARPLPPVQRPGVSQPRGAGASEAIEALDRRLSRTGNPKDAAALLAASRRARRS